MPPKTTKQLAAHAKKVVEDKTFGMKNKNRSAKVQQQIQHLTESVKSGSKEAQKKQAELAEKKSAKQAKLEFEAEMARLFKVAEDKKKSDEAAAAAAAAAAGGQGDEAAKVGPDGEYLWQAEDFEEVAADETRLEEQLEAEREALKLRTDLTPVTEETFRAWRQRKIQEAADAEAARLKKAKEGAGKLKGWDLWQDNADLFVDDEEAEAVYEREFEEEPAGSILDADVGGAKHVDPMAE